MRYTDAKIRSGILLKKIVCKTKHKKQALMAIQIKQMVISKALWEQKADHVSKSNFITYYKN